MASGIDGLRVLVTAGGSGIGLEMVRAFHAAGARVHTCDVRDDFAATADLDGVTSSLADVSDRGDVDRLFAEIRERLKEELDYENEARNIELFREFHKDQPWVLIPSVAKSHSTRRVLTMELVEGDHVSKVTRDRYDQDTINLIGHRI